MIFDIYLSQTWTINPDPPLSVCLLYKHIALACFEISFKLTTADAKHLENFLSMVFADFHFNDDELMNYEIQILHLLGNKIAPNLSPSVFFTSFLESTGTSLSSISRAQLQQHYNTTIKLCLLGNFYLYFMIELKVFHRFFVPAVFFIFCGLSYDTLHMLYG